MRGHIKERSPGRWAIVLDVRDPETGWRRRCQDRHEHVARSI
jgi:hypothetical protein